MSQNNEAVMEPISSKPEHKSYFSWPLFKQSFKANWVLWLVLTLGSAAIFIIVNLVVGTKAIFTNIDIASVQQYVKDENMNWLQILGLLQTMGFSLSRIEVMSQLDLNAIMNDLIYKIAGVLLPMIYVMIVANKLLAAQVSDGSMAYVLSTPTARKKVVRTQYLFIVASLAAMYLIITIAALGTGAIANYIVNLTAKVETPFNYFFLKSALYCLGSFLSMFALTGVCFGASAFFNKSNQSIAVGGGVCVLCFLCCILGLFGNKVFVSVGVGVQAMNVFNYFTLYTLIDTDSIASFSKAVTNFGSDVISYNWIWEFGILVLVGIIFAFAGSKYFIKKDLPL